MKNLTKIFMAVAAGMLAFSCVTDTTGDLAPELGLGEGQQTTLTLSLEESRTYLGEKAGEIYPLYWSENDVIAVNGTASTGISILEETEAAARFSFGENTVSRPFHVIYPAPAEGMEAVTEGCYPVVFPATQVYAEGTFAAGTAPMYGYAAAPAEGEEAAPIQMQHLTGILRLAVKGDVTLSTLVIKAESGSLSGTYDVNCESGALTAQEGSTSDTVTVSFDGGLALKADEATPIYVAVPAGSYGAVRAILTTTEGKKMTIKFDSDSKPIAKATVREFTEFKFAENTLDGDVFEIYDVEDMLMFAKTATSFPWSEAKLMATVDMSGVEWTPVDGFSKIFNGNYSETTPYEIKNLSAPLFGTTTATIKNVKLTDVNMNSSGRKIFGALACEMYCAIDETTILENCEVHGNIVIENENLTLSSEDKDLMSALCYGGLVGALNGGDVVGCKNYATITVKQIADLNNTITTYPVLGGLVGAGKANIPEEGIVVTGAFTNCENRGELKYEDNAKAFLYRAIVGGVVGYTNTDFDAVLTNCDNYANISLNSIVTGNSGGTSPAALAGIVGYFYHATADDCDNSGSITFDGKAQTIGVGGLFGYSSNSVHRNCHNTGVIELKESSRVLGIMVGGIGAALYNPNSNAVGLTENCSNNAPINVLCSTDEDNKKNGAYYYRVGGITAFCRQPITDSNNLTNGDITISGKWIHMSSTERSINLAGAIGYKTKGAVTNVNNYGDLNVSSDITINSTDTDVIEAQPLNIAGVVSDSSYSVNSNNYGNITFSGSYTGYRVFIAGILANGIDNNVSPYQDCTNSGDITITKDATFTISNYLYVGGCCAASEATARSGLTNSGNIIINGTVKKVSSENTDGTVTESGGSCRIGGVMGYFTLAHSKLRNTGNITFGSDAVIYGETNIGGVVGYPYSTTTTLIFSEYTNTGKITFNGNNKGTLYLGGITARPYGATMQNMYNQGEIALNGIYDGRIYLGGCFGFHNTDKIVKLVNCENTTPITINGTYNNTEPLYVGGVCGYMQGAGTHSQIYNREGGKITINLTKMVANVYVAGITGKFQDASSDVENHGEIKILGTYDKSVFIAGLIASSNNYIRTNHLNAGNIIVEANINEALCIGGLYPYGPYGKATTNFSNTGNFTVKENTKVQNSVYIGGVYGYYVGSDANFALTANSNSGNFIFAGECGISTTPPTSTSYNTEYMLCMGGLVGQTRSDTHKITITDGFVNSGKMEFTGSNENGSVCIGGLVGDMSTSTTGWTGTLVNTGDIFCTGRFKNTGYVGGIFGKTSVSVTDGQCFCSIKATENYYTGVGWITGGARVPATADAEAIVASNCKVGGKIATYDQFTASWIATEMDKDLFYEYIYGSGVSTDWTGTDNYDGCTWLEKKEDIVVPTITVPEDTTTEGSEVAE